MKSAAFAFASVTTSAAAAVEARRMDNAMALRRAERENVMTSPPCEEFDLHLDDLSRPPSMPLTSEWRIASLAAVKQVRAALVAAGGFCGRRFEPGILLHVQEPGSPQECPRSRAR